MESKEELVMLGRIEGRLEEMRANTVELKSAVRRIEDGLTKRLDDHAYRLRKLELDAARTGALYGAGAASTILAIWEGIKHLLFRGP